MSELIDFAGEMGLTDQQDIFCREFVDTLSIKESAEAAKFNYDWARKLRWLPHIASHIKFLMDQRRERLNISADYVLLRLHEVESLDIGEVFDGNGNLLRVDEMSSRARRSIKSIETSYVQYGDKENKVKVTTKKVAFESRLTALNLMGKHTGVGAFITEGPPPANQTFILNMMGVKDGDESPYLEAEYTEESDDQQNNQEE